MEKLIGTASSGHGGTLFTVFSQIHGNEPAGTKALQNIFIKLIQHPDIQIKGTFIGILGNLAAAQKGKRYLEQDLNRMWSEANVQKIKNTAPGLHGPEEHELLENLRVVENAIQESRPERIAILDLHTTTAEGGIFTFPNSEVASGELADPIGAPVIHGMTNYLSGTTLHYFTSGRYGLPIASTAFEAGQHEEKKAVERCGEAVVRCLVHLGMLEKKAAQNIAGQDFDLNHSPTEHWDLVHRHPVKEGDGFMMRPGYRNFQPISKGEILADGENGPIPCPIDGNMLMPLYQKMGADGFFVIVRKLF